MKLKISVDLHDIAFLCPVGYLVDSHDPQLWLGEATQLRWKDKFTYLEWIEGWFNLVVKRRSIRNSSGFNPGLLMVVW